MLKPKKPIQQQQSTAKPDSNLGKLASKETPEEDESEMPETPKHTLKKKPVLASKQKSGLAAAFDAVPISNNAKNIPPGTYEAIIRRFVIQQPDAKGQSARIEYELCDPEFQGKENSVTGWFKLLEPDLRTPGGGMKPFKIALAKLGYEPENSEEAEACLQEITENNPGVLIKITYDDNYPDYPRTRIESESDSEVVENYRDNVVY
jgi:hypothetical protein